jgi:hypothetical protein
LSDAGWDAGVAEVLRQVEEFRKAKHPPSEDAWLQIYKVSTRDIYTHGRERFREQLDTLRDFLGGDERLVLMKTASRLLDQVLLAVTTSRLLWVDEEHVRWHGWSAESILRSSVSGQELRMRLTDGTSYSFRLISFDAARELSQALDRAGLLKDR